MGYIHQRGILAGFNLYAESECRFRVSKEIQGNAAESFLRITEHLLNIEQRIEQMGSGIFLNA